MQMKKALGKFIAILYDNQLNQDLDTDKSDRIEFETYAVLHRMSYEDCGRLKNDWGLIKNE
ncbi:uncharacterized protein EAF01_000761 [Botrytis porri]|uniref:Uncharacterized protein n=1 Tax=Botrytis porri TaxID=87229 RepID=A0A4Z1K7I7_9HELO|nr:uncharacterized protein EAF01_000761 [Botrytis porri]KAF7914355.1 hypothetical protein EAF01_000761 [Botrytis porri]TGO81416.1 hypothetical protein BPOR_1165g00030 [Botrytis porri]